VVVACAGTIHAARDVAKQHTYRLDAFSSGDAGPIGYVEEGRLRLLRDWPAADPEAAGRLSKFTAATRWPRVEIVMNHAGAGGTLVEALVAQGVEGLVVAGTGNGTVHADLLRALLAAADGGMRVVRSTRCAAGQVIAHPSDHLPTSMLAPAKARIELLLALLA
jgi:L-asparaginase